MRYVIILTFSLTCFVAFSAESPRRKRFEIYLKGSKYRLGLQGKEVPLRFTAVDGRPVDLSKMRGKVVLVDFWFTACAPCVAALPRLKAAYQKYHARGFEIIGVNSDTDKETLERFLKKKGIVWPQYFEGQLENQVSQEFGINGWPHMFLVDKKGCLRFDDVKASGAKAEFEDKIESLLAEP